MKFEFRKQQPGREGPERGRRCKRGATATFAGEEEEV